MRAVAVFLLLLAALTMATRLRRHDAAETRFAVRLEAGADADAVAAAVGMENLGSVGALAHTYVFQSVAERRRRATFEAESNATLAAHEHVRWWERQRARLLVKRGGAYRVFDPEFKNQWHLQAGPASINVQSVWDAGLLGSGVVVCIVDDGLQMTHPDLSESFEEELSYDFNDDDPDVTPSPSIDDHGTSAAGACCARRNVAAAGDATEDAFCGVGVAPLAHVSAVRLVSRATEDYQEVGVGYMADKGNDVYSNSWGPPDDGQRLEGPGPLAYAAREHAMQVGRGGLGVIYVWAAGNGRSRGDNCNYDGWANHRYALTIGAVTDDLEQPYYSENCASMFAVAPSGGASRAITTTDLLGSVGTSTGPCTNRFGGTSAAAPIAAGVVALVLEANPRLGWRDVQGVIALSSKPISTSEEGWQTNGAKLQFSHQFGFGLIDAANAVATAKAWTNYESPSVLSSGDMKPLTGIGSAMKVTQQWHCENVHKRVLHVDVTLDVAYPHRGELRVLLVSPSGTVSELQEVHGDQNADIHNWTYSTVANWHENPHGNWQIVVENSSKKNHGAWRSWRIDLHLVDK